MDNLSQVIGGRIRGLRERAGLNQVEFAARLRVSSSAINQYEAGHKKPSIELILRIAKDYGVSADYLLGYGEKTGILLDAEVVSFLEEYARLQPRDRSLLNKIANVMRDGD